MRGFSRRKKFYFFVAVDVLSIPIAFLGAALLGGGEAVASALEHPWAVTLCLLMTAIAGGCATVLIGLPRIRLNSFETTAIVRSMAYAGLVGLGLVVISIPVGLAFDYVIGARFLVIFTMTLALTTVCARLVMREVLLLVYKKGGNRKRVLIYGAGQTGLQLAKVLDSDGDLEPVAFVDDNPTLHNLMIAGLRVYPPIRIEDLLANNQIDHVVIAIPSISRPKQARLAEKLEDLGCEISVLPSFAALITDGEDTGPVHPLTPSDFLNRDHLECDLDGLCGVYDGASVMITGAGGSIGSELVRQILTCKPATLVLFEISEIALYQLLRELGEMKSNPSTRIIPVLGSVTDEMMARSIIREHDVSVIIHTAAYKHVNVVEKNVLAGISNNIFGTKIIAEAARDEEVKHFILISTDKAVRPSNIMGLTKRFAEMIVLNLARQNTKTRFGIVRFGNVLGSSGSVIPLFSEQIDRGGPVTVTDERVTRYFMTLSEATRLVLLTGNYSRGGETFILDMGKPVSIVSLAEQMIAAAGYSLKDRQNPDGDIEILIKGLQPGEKLNEELYHPDGSMEPTEHTKIARVTEPYVLSELDMARAYKALNEVCQSGDAAAARAVLREVSGPPESMDPALAAQTRLLT